MLLREPALAVVDRLRSIAVELEVDDDVEPSAVDETLAVDGVPGELYDNDSLPGSY